MRHSPCGERGRTAGAGRAERQRQARPAAARCPRANGGFQQNEVFIIMRSISTSVLFMPTLPIRPMFAIVPSTVSDTKPSPGLNTLPSKAISWAKTAASTAAAIFAAHDGFAPSHTIPPTLAKVFVIVSQICL